jgi:hypothetical protein
MFDPVRQKKQAAGGRIQGAAVGQQLPRRRNFPQAAANGADGLPQLVQRGIGALGVEPLKAERTALVVRFDPGVTVMAQQQRHRCVFALGLTR